MQLHGIEEENKTDHKEYRYRPNAETAVVGYLGYNADGHCAEEGRPLAAYIQKPEVLARFLRRYYLGEVGTGERLYPALEKTDYDGKDPEVDLLVHEHREHRYAEVGCNADRQQKDRGHPF